MPVLDRIKKLSISWLPIHFLSVKMHLKAARKWQRNVSREIYRKTFFWWKFRFLDDILFSPVAFNATNQGFIFLAQLPTTSSSLRRILEHLSQAWKFPIPLQTWDLSRSLIIFEKRHFLSNTFSHNIRILNQKAFFSQFLHYWQNCSRSIRKTTDQISAQPY